MLALENNKHYTYSDYFTWGDDTRYELIDGTPYMMSPAPSRVHQEISEELFSQLHSFLRSKHCKVYHAPFDVRLNPDDADDTVIQPDISVICDNSKLDDKGCRGVPDMIIEILSPSSTKLDRITKFNKYLQVGVREYWIVDPSSKIISVYILENKKYIASAYCDTDTISVRVLDGCYINLNHVFNIT